MNADSFIKVHGCAAVCACNGKLIPLYRNILVNSLIVQCIFYDEIIW